MCGRAALGLSEQQLAALFSTRPLSQPQQQQYQPNYNIRPSAATPIIRRSQGQTELVLLNWGISIPNSSKHVINARCEGMNHKPMFRSLVDHHRCVMPTIGFYEWSPDKRPHIIKIKDQQLTNLACLYTDAGHFVIITCNAAPEISKIHDRMPVVLTDEGLEKWLDVDTYSFLDCKELLHPFQGELEFWPVNPLKGIDESCIKPSAEPSQSRIASYMQPKLKSADQGIKTPDRKRAALQGTTEDKTVKKVKSGPSLEVVPESSDSDRIPYDDTESDKKSKKIKLEKGVKRSRSPIKPSPNRVEKQQSIKRFFKPKALA